MKKIIFCILTLTSGISDKVNAATAIACVFRSDCETPGPMGCLTLSPSKSNPTLQLFGITYTGGKTMTLSAKESDLRPYINEMISGNSFECTDDTSIQDKLCDALGIKRSSKIPAGRYKCSRSNGTIIIEFVIKEQGVK